MGLTVHISAEEEAVGASRSMMSPEMIRTQKYQKQIQEALEKYGYLKGEAW